MMGMAGILKGLSDILLSSGLKFNEIAIGATKVLLAVYLMGYSVKVLRQYEDKKGLDGLIAVMKGYLVGMGKGLLGFSLVYALVVLI